MLSNHKSNAKVALTITIFLTMLLLAISCKECPSEPKPEPEYNIYLSIEDVLCTWVTLKVTLPDSGKINSFALDRNDSTIATYTCNDNDTLITDEGLTPDTDFSYKVRFLKDGKTKAESEPVAVHTMQTTSHHFVWEIDTLGEYGSSLHDVTAIGENDVWAVGEIKANDKLYGAVHWDGEKWNFIELKVGLEIVRPRGILVLSSNDIWFACGSIYHWDGSETTLEWLRNIDTPETVEKVWGTSSSNLYFVGNAGTIVHYDGSNFTRMTSGTDANLLKIAGIYNPATGKSRIWVTGTGILLYYDSSEWQTIWDQDHPYFDNNYINPTAIYIPDDKYIILSTWNGYGSRITLHNQDDFGQYQVLFYADGDYIRFISGIDVNDFFLVGTYTKVAHYNGETYHKYEELESFGILSSCFMINNAVFTVGYQGAFQSKGIVFRGKR